MFPVLVFALTFQAPAPVPPPATAHVPATTASVPARKTPPRIYTIRPYQGDVLPAPPGRKG